MMPDPARSPVATRARAQEFIFVTGASRSGTTVLSRIIGNADPVLALNELHFFGELVDMEDSARPLPRDDAVRIVGMTFARHARDYWVKGPTPAELSRARSLVDALAEEDRDGETLFAVTMDAIRREASVDRLCEQTPRNAYYAAKLLHAYPNARVVHIVRDPRAVLASQKRRYKIRSLGGRNVPVAEVIRLWVNYHPFSMVALWKSAVKAASSLADDPRFLLLRYEDLVADPSTTLQSLCEFLGLDADEDMTNVPHWGSSTVEHRSSGGLSTASLDKWRAVLNGGEIRYCEIRTRDERARFGYEDSGFTGGRLAGYLGMLLRAPVHAVGALLTNPGRVVTLLRALFNVARGRD